MSPQALHRHLFLRDLAAVDKQSSDASIGSAVGAGIADQKAPAIFQLQYARALYVKKEKVDGILHPGNLVIATAQRAQFIDLSPGIVRYGIADHIGRHAVNRISILRRWRQTPFYHRLVIAGEQNRLQFSIAG